MPSTSGIHRLAEADGEPAPFSSTTAPSTFRYASAWRTSATSRASSRRGLWDGEGDPELRIERLPGQYDVAEAELAFLLEAPVLVVDVVARPQETLLDRGGSGTLPEQPTDEGRRSLPDLDHSEFQRRYEERLPDEDRASPLLRRREYGVGECPAEVRASAGKPPSAPARSSSSTVSR